LEQERNNSSVMRAWARDLLLSLLIAAVVILFIYQPVQVEGTSMMPALVDQERIFINKFTYRLGIEKINRGDMVVFWFPGGPDKSYIKRVIGGLCEWQQAAGGLCPLTVPRCRLHGGVEGQGRLLLCSGRPSLLIQRQPLLGPGPQKLHLRQSCVRLLAPREDRPGAVVIADPSARTGRKAAG
jgi:hypothetical protein